MKKKIRSTRSAWYIGLDLDGVIIDHTHNKIRLARSFGFNIKKEQTPSEIFKNIIPHRTCNQIKKRLYGLLSLKARPVPSALWGIKKLKNLGCKLFIISKRRNARIAMAWLQGHNVLNVIPRRNVFFRRSENQKGALAKKLNLDIFLDDETKVLKKFKHTPNLVLFNFYQTALPRGPWRQIKSWKAFVKLVLKNKKRLS